MPVGDRSCFAVAGSLGVTGTQTRVSVPLRRDTGSNACAACECPSGASVDMAVEDFGNLANFDTQLSKLFRKDGLHSIRERVFGFMMYFN